MEVLKSEGENTDLSDTENARWESGSFSEIRKHHSIHSLQAQDPGHTEELRGSLPSPLGPQTVSRSLTSRSLSFFSFKMRQILKQIKCPFGR